MLANKAYKFRLYPSKKQIELIKANITTGILTQDKILKMKR